MKILVVPFICFVTTFAGAQSVGTKVKMIATDGKEYSGVIKEVDGDKFKVKYDGSDFEYWLLSTQFTVIKNNSGENTIAQNTGRKVGDKIIAKDDVNNWLEAEIIEIANGKYKVHYAGYSGDWKDAWITENWIKPLNTKTPATTNPNTNQSNTNPNTNLPNPGHKVGDKIIAKDNVNNWLEAEIMEIVNGKYKVHYAGYSSNWDAWITEDWIKPLNTKTPATTNPNTNLPKDPEMNGAIPKIIGTAWYVLAIYDKGTTPTNNHVHTPYIFFKSGRYEYQNNYVTMGTYRVSGNKLTQVSDGADKLTETYTITWNAKEKYMELTSGNTVIRLTYNTKTSG